MGKKLAKFVLLICILVVLLYCGLIAKPEEEVEVEEEIVTITASDEAIKYSEENFDATSTSLTKDEQIEYFNTVTLPGIMVRPESTFPEVETDNTLKKESHDYGDVYTLSNGDDYDCIVLYIHGNAWVWEIKSQQVEFCDKLVEPLNAKVVIPFYGLYPQSTFRDTYTMISKVYKDLLKEDKPIILMGDSAGGAMSLGLALDLLAKDIELPEKIVLLSPVADGTFSNDEMDDYQSKDPLLARYECLEYIKLWADGEDLTSTAFSPVNGNYTNCPDVLMFVGNCDILYPDEMKLYEKMKSDGANVSLVVGDGLWHVFSIFDIPERDKCVSIIKEFCEEE